MSVPNPRGHVTGTGSLITWTRHPASGCTSLSIPARYRYTLGRSPRVDPMEVWGADYVQ
jgi:hypothetical protein